MHKFNFLSEHISGQKSNKATTKATPLAMGFQRNNSSGHKAAPSLTNLSQHSYQPHWFCLPPRSDKGLPKELIHNKGEHKAHIGYHAKILMYNTTTSP